jgi:hypothetical protein
MFKHKGKLMAAAFCLAVIWLVSAPAAYANDWDKATRITVNQPFEIPGMILPAGTYIVKIVDLAGERHVVRFFSEDESKIYATIIGIPDFRLTPTDDTSLTFYESRFNRPRALHAWFYPGYQYGIEFAYPENQAFDIASVGEEHVIVTKEPLPYLGEKPTDFGFEEEEFLAVEPGGEEVAVAEVHPEFTPEPEPAFAPEPEVPAPALPKTATPFPLMALVGLLSAGTAFGIRSFHK